MISTKYRDSNLIFKKLCFLFMISVIFIACGIITETKHDSIVFMAGYKPQANLPFAAVYVAKEEGFYSEQGVDVEIRHASSGEHIPLLLAGKVDVTTADAATVLKRNSDLNESLVAIALLGRTGQQGFMSLKSSGIKDVKDWEGRSFGYKVSIPPEYFALLSKEGVDSNQIIPIRVGFDPRILTEGKVEILAVYLSNEPNLVKNMGHDVSIWDPSDYGIPTLGLTFVTNDTLLENKKDVLVKFMVATIKAINYIKDNYEYSLDIVMKYAPNEDRSHMSYMLKTELEAARKFRPLDQSKLGWMEDYMWEELVNYLVQYDALNENVNYKDSYTNKVLKEVYDR
tara:strand:+ start:8599 stop:9621 length:1023 start_codon:yes stop_codon:yes gene_type:complete